MWDVQSDRQTFLVSSDWTNFESTMWNLSLFGLDLVVIIRSIVVPSSLSSEGLEEKQPQVVDMWTGPLLFSLAPLQIR